MDHPRPDALSTPDDILLLDFETARLRGGILAVTCLAGHSWQASLLSHPLVDGDLLGLDQFKGVTLKLHYLTGGWDRAERASNALGAPILRQGAKRHHLTSG